MEILRPKKLSEFVGKEKIKEILNAMIKGAIARNEPVDHILLIGSAGLGKTTLANIVANEFGSNITTLVGNSVNQDISVTLSNLQEKEILFIDEIHRIPNKFQEILYPAMEQRKLFLTIGKGKINKKTVEIESEPFTLIGATTNAGMLSKPLRDRFGITFELDFYNLKEMEIIVQNNVKKLNLNINSEGITEISKRSRFTPRIANNILKRVRDFTEPQENITVSKLKEIFEKLEIDEIGLDANDRKVLSALNSVDYPIGIENVNAMTNVDTITIEQVCEPYLVQQNLITRTPRGRIITEKGKEIIKGGWEK